MNMLTLHWKRIGLVSMLLCLAGCLGSSPHSQFYLLETISNANPKLDDNRAKTLIALTPVRIPEYLDRQQIVTATSKNAYQLSEYDRWAEPLNSNIARVLQQNLMILVPAEVILSSTSNRTKQANLRVSVNVLEFHIDPQHQAIS